MHMHSGTAYMPHKIPFVLSLLAWASLFLSPAMLLLFDLFLVL